MADFFSIRLRFAMNAACWQQVSTKFCAVIITSLEMVEGTLDTVMTPSAYAAITK